MHVIMGDAATEYQALMTEKAREAKRLETRIKEDQKDLGTIKKEVKEILGDLGGPEERVVFPTGIGEAWDRRVSGLDESLDVGLLEAQLGKKRFRGLCSRETVYTLNLDALELARRQGEVTDADLQAATVRGEPSYSLYRLVTEQVIK